MDFKILRNKVAYGKRITMKKVEDYVRSIPDFPEKGIIFRDVTSVLQDAEGLQLAIDGIDKILKDVEYDVVVGPRIKRIYIWSTYCI